MPRAGSGRCCSIWPKTRRSFTAHQAEIDRLYGYLAQWGRRLAQRVTKSEDDIKAMRGRSLRRGILPFLVDGSEVDEELTARYRGPAPAKFVDR